MYLTFRLFLAGLCILDDFNRANQTPIGGMWSNYSFITTLSRLRIVSNALAAGTNPDYASGFLGVVGRDCEMSFDIVAVPTSYIFLAARMSNVSVGITN